MAGGTDPCPGRVEGASRGESRHATPRRRVDRRRGRVLRNPSGIRLRPRRLAGDASDPKGISSDTKKLQVFAGLRDDPFFFNQDGFDEMIEQTKAALAMSTPDAAGCPALDTATSTSILTQLHRGKMAAAATDR